MSEFVFNSQLHVSNTLRISEIPKIEFTTRNQPPDVIELFFHCPLLSLYVQRSYFLCLAPWFRTFALFVTPFISRISIKRKNTRRWFLSECSRPVWFVQLRDNCQTDSFTGVAQSLGGGRATECVERNGGWSVVYRGRKRLAVSSFPSGYFATLVLRATHKKAGFTLLEILFSRTSPPRGKGAVIDEPSTKLKLIRKPTGAQLVTSSSRGSLTKLSRWLEFRWKRWSRCLLREWHTRFLFLILWSEGLFNLANSEHVEFRELNWGTFGGKRSSLVG